MQDAVMRLAAQPAAQPAAATLLLSNLMASGVPDGASRPDGGEVYVRATLLGHEPESCNGDMTTLTHLFTEEFLHLQVPLLIAAFEEGSLIDGFTDNVKLVNAAGQTMKFEYRMSLSPTDPRKALLIFRLKADRVQIQEPGGDQPKRRWCFRLIYDADEHGKPSNAPEEAVYWGERFENGVAIAICLNIAALTLYGDPMSANIRLAYEVLNVVFVLADASAPAASRRMPRSAASSSSARAASRRTTRRARAASR